MKNRKKANLGKKLELLIDITNIMYREEGLADVVKVPTPVRIMSVSGSIVRGVKQHGYIVDYIGVVKGHAIAFDAKETKGKSFPLKNLHEHQYNMMKSWNDNGSTTFLIVNFTELNEYYLLPFVILEECWNNAKEGGRGTKSIPLKTFQEKCKMIKKHGSYLDYLEEL